MHLLFTIQALCVNPISRRDPARFFFVSHNVCVIHNTWRNHITVHELAIDLLTSTCSDWREDTTFHLLFTMRKNLTLISNRIKCIV
jgi:hypothetical protein